MAASRDVRRSFPRDVRRSFPRDAAWLAGAWAIAAALIALSRAPAADMHHRVKETSDVYMLPPPEQVVALSLGHRAAVADYLWATVRVEQGLHTLDKRRYENLPYLVDTINALDPTFRDPYLLIEPLTTFQVNAVPLDDIRRARQIMERGLANLPDDAELLAQTGTFVGLIAPSSYLTDPAEINEWKETGAKYLERAAELGGDASNVGWQAISGVGLLRKLGKRREAIKFAQHALASTDDEELRAHIKAILDKMTQAEDAFEEAEQRKAFAAFRGRQDRFDEIWRKRYPLASRTGALVLGPPYEAAYCAGGLHPEDERCAFDWGGWAARVEAAQRR